MRTKLTDQVALSGPKATVTGEFGSKGFAIDGVPLEFSAGNLRDIIDGKIGYEVTITYPTRKSRRFIFEAKNAHRGSISSKDIPKAISDLVPPLTAPRTYPNGGNPLAFYLNNRRWTYGSYTDSVGFFYPEASPGFADGINLYLADDALLHAEGLSVANVVAEIVAATKTWDNATNCNLFADTNIVTPDTTIVPGKYDKKNTIEFRTFNIGCNALATAGTWYRMMKVDGYNPIIESDISINAKYTWRTAPTGAGYDLQAVILHELGHTIGLADIYGTSKNDGKQIMGYYSGRRTLGNGDAAAVFKLYG